MSVKKAAKKFLRKINRNLDFLTVKQYYEKNGWKIHYFSESDSIIEELELQEKAQREKGFIYNEGNIKYIFINVNLSEREKRDVIFHEAGHIELNHEYSDLNNNAIERQANEFANILIDFCSNNTHNNKTVIVLLSVIAILLIINLIICSGLNNDAEIQTAIPKTTDTDIAVENNINDEQQYVYVTPSGKKYHLQDCYYIRNNPKAYKIDITTAEQSYIPCSVCVTK